MHNIETLVHTGLPVFNFLLIIVFATALTSCASKDNDNTTQADTLKTELYVAVPAAPPDNFKHQTKSVNGINIHYVIGGEGPPLVLVHGFGQTWYMWNRLLPEFSKHFTVIVPELRGIGESDKPPGGYDKKTMARDIHELVSSLGFKRIKLVGHDIGLMVSYAYAAQFGDEVEKIALLDAFIPGVEPVWTKMSTTIWHFGFFSRPIAGDLIAGKEKEFLYDFWPQQYGVNKAPFTQAEMDEFVRAYSTNGSTTGSFHWFGAFPQDVEDNKEFTKKKLKMPLLAMGGEFSCGPFLADHAKLVAENVEEVKIAGSGHWMVQEQTEQVKKGLMDFLKK